MHALELYQYGTIYHCKFSQLCTGLYLQLTARLHVRIHQDIQYLTLNHHHKLAQMGKQTL